MEKALQQALADAPRPASATAPLPLSLVLRVASAVRAIADSTGLTLTDVSAIASATTPTTLAQLPVVCPYCSTSARVYVTPSGCINHCRKQHPGKPVPPAFTAARTAYRQGGASLPADESAAAEVAPPPAASARPELSVFGTCNYDGPFASTDVPKLHQETWQETQLYKELRKHFDGIYTNSTDDALLAVSRFIALACEGAFPRATTVPALNRKGNPTARPIEGRGDKARAWLTMWCAEHIGFVCRKSAVLHFASVIMNTGLNIKEKTRGKWVCYAKKFLEWLPGYWSNEFGKPCSYFAPDAPPPTSAHIHDAIAVLNIKSTAIQRRVERDTHLVDSKLQRIKDGVPELILKAEAHIHEWTLKTLEEVKAKTKEYPSLAYARSMSRMKNKDKVTSVGHFAAQALNVAAKLRRFVLTLLATMEMAKRIGMYTFTIGDYIEATTNPHLQQWQLVDKTSVITANTAATEKHIAELRAREAKGASMTEEVLLEKHGLAKEMVALISNTSFKTHKEFMVNTLAVGAEMRRILDDYLHFVHPCPDNKDAPFFAADIKSDVSVAMSDAFKDIGVDYKKPISLTVLRGNLVTAIKAGRQLTEGEEKAMHQAQCHGGAQADYICQQLTVYGSWGRQLYVNAMAAARGKRSGDEEVSAPKKAKVVAPKEASPKEASPKKPPKEASPKKSPKEASPKKTPPKAPFPSAMALANAKDRGCPKGVDAETWEEHLNMTHECYLKNHTTLYYPERVVEAKVENGDVYLSVWWYGWDKAGCTWQLLEEECDLAIRAVAEFYMAGLKDGKVKEAIKEVLMD